MSLSNGTTHRGILSIPPVGHKYICSFQREALYQSETIIKDMGKYYQYLLTFTVKIKLMALILKLFVVVVVVCIDCFGQVLQVNIN